MTKASRHIPAPVKLAVRKKCNYGCVICGLLLVHYDHVDEFAEVQEHDVDNLVLLCPNHHQDKTSGRMSADVVRRYAERPHNLGKKVTPPHRLHLIGDTGRFSLGNSVEMTFSFSPGKDLFIHALLSEEQPDGSWRYDTSFAMRNENGFLLIDLLITDDTGNELLRIVDSEMVFYLQGVDYIMVGKTVIIRRDKEPIARFKIRRDGLSIAQALCVWPGGEFSMSGEGPATHWMPGYAVAVTPNHTEVSVFPAPNSGWLRNLNVAGCTFTDCTAVAVLRRIKEGGDEDYEGDIERYTKKKRESFDS